MKTKAFLLFVLIIVLYLGYKLIFPTSLKGLQLQKFPQINTYSSSIYSTSLLNEDADSASLLILFSSYSKNSVLGLFINKDTGQIRTDTFEEMQYGVEKIHYAVLGCNKEREFCILINNNRMKGQIVPKSLMRYNYKVGSVTTIFSFPQNTHSLQSTCSAGNELGIKTTEGTFTVHINSDNPQVVTGINTTCEQSSKVDWSNYELLVSSDLKDYKTEQKVLADSVTISDGCSGFCSVTKDFYLKKQDGTTIFTFRSINNDIRPLGYFGGRYYFHGKLTEGVDLRGFIGYVDLRKKDN